MQDPLARDGVLPEWLGSGSHVEIIFDRRPQLASLGTLICGGSVQSYEPATAYQLRRGHGYSVLPSIAVLLPNLRDRVVCVSVFG